MIDQNKVKEQLEEIFDKYKFSPSGNKIKLYKAIHGDKSDNIENAVPYLPENILLDIINNFQDVNDFLKRFWNERKEIRLSSSHRMGSISGRMTGCLTDWLKAWSFPNAHPA